MVELDEATRRALLAREGPPASARAEILAGLRARLDGPRGPDDPGEPDLGGSESMPLEGAATAGGQIAWAAKLVGATIGLAAAGVLTLQLGAVAYRSLREQPKDAHTQAQVSDEVEHAAVVEPHEVVDEAPQSDQAEETASESETEAAPRPAAAPARNEATKTDSTLAAELELLRAAKQLRARAPEAALAKLELHRERFADGSLAPEREAMRVELLCTLGRHAAAAKARARFLEHYGDSPLRARVLANCADVGTDHASAGD